MVIKTIFLSATLGLITILSQQTPTVKSYNKHIGTFMITGHIINGRMMQDTATEINPVTLGETLHIRRYIGRTGRWDYYDGITYCAFRDYDSDSVPMGFFEEIPDSIFDYAEVDTQYLVYDTIR